MAREAQIKRIPVNGTVLRLGREVAVAANHLSRVLVDETRPEDTVMLQDYLRRVLLRLEESAASGRFLR